ncbi:MAG TPA: glycoside hydrolase family 38 C-terminal domain-containing protein [Terracidiphilus sp.]|nr:glycoside hydrolase family 38 C-terminal domain-containing protein [Terracidiphilus sp.]
MRFSRFILLAGLLATTAVPCLAIAQSNESPDLTKQPTLYVVGYAHLDTEWRWEYPQVIDEYLRKTMEGNFKLFEKYPHYIFNFSGANRYRLMKEYYPADFAELQKYVKAGRWFPAGSSMEEGDVNAPGAEGIIRQVLYGNNWFRRELGTASMEYMLPDCFGFPSSLPTILAHSGVKGFSTQKLSWGSSARAGGRESLEETPEGVPFNVGVWVGPDGESVLAGLNPGAYSGGISSDLSKPLPEESPNPAFAELQQRMGAIQQTLEQEQHEGKPFDQKAIQDFFALRSEQEGLAREQEDETQSRHQRDWAARVQQNGKVTGIFTDYHYYGTGDIGGTPDEESVQRLEATVTGGSAEFPPPNTFLRFGEKHPEWPKVQVGNGPVHVVSAKADQMFLDITPTEAEMLPRYTGEMELTNHSAGSLTSQAYQKRWIRHEELLANAAEESAVVAQWLGGRPYPLDRLNGAWTLAMGAHFHDLAAGTATPRAYEFAWNDDVIALNQFADVLKSSVQAVAAALDTQAQGVPLVVFNPLNIAREDVVEATVHFPGGTPSQVHVVAPGGQELPAQIDHDKVLFIANVPSVGYAVYDVRPGGTSTSAESTLRVSNTELENEYYRVTLNQDGDVSSIYDKRIDRELLSAPARLALSYDNPSQWPAWNMDWSQEQAAPKAYVSGPAKIRVVESGPVRVAIEVTRETAGSRFIQTIRLASGDPGKRVEFANIIDWSSRETNLKATFPLAAHNALATYNWDIGTIQRPSAEPKKFEVPSHQWIDLTDMSGKFGATILTDSKNGSDKPNDNTIRLTLVRTPGVAGGYPDQSTQDIGHHEFVYGIAGHAGGWRDAQTDWQAQQLNTPLTPFETTAHSGALGKSFSLLKVDNPRVRVLAVKKAEDTDEIVVRLVELDGKPESDVHLAFAAPLTSAREVNGQEQPIGPATVKNGVLTASFGAYQPRTFAVRFDKAAAHIEGEKSTPVSLHFSVATASNDGERSATGFDGAGSSLPAEMLPSVIHFNGIDFQLGQAKTGAPNAIIARGQAIQLPGGKFNRIYLLAASASGDQKADFDVAGRKVQLNIEDWGGFVGQWDDRLWSSNDVAHDHYGDMVGLKPGFIKRADLAWFCSHHHDAAGKNVPYAYSYLFAYGLDLPPGARSLKLPDNSKLRILAISVAEEEPAIAPARPLYDELPSSKSGPADFSVSGLKANISVAQGHSTTARVMSLPWGDFDSPVQFAVTGIPHGVTTTFDHPTTDGSATLSIHADPRAAPATTQFTVTATAGTISHTLTSTLEVTAVLSGTIPIDLASSYNITAMYKDGSTFKPEDSIDNDGNALSAEQTGTDEVGGGVNFKLGPANAPNAVSGKTIPLPVGIFASVRLLAIGTNGTQRHQNFTVNYTDGTSSSFVQTVSDWADPEGTSGESPASELAYRLENDGDKDSGPFFSRAYAFPIEAGKTAKSITLPANRDVVILAATLVPAS